MIERLREALAERYRMPYIEGGSLRDRLDHEKQLPVDDALRVACEVADVR